MERKISIEVEYPVIDNITLSGLSQERFRKIWSDLKDKNWKVQSDPVNGLATGVVRQIKVQPDCLSSKQCIVTDTGPLIELVPHPETNIFDLQTQLDSIKQIMFVELESVNAIALGMGIHPLTSDSKKEYYKLRTPRSAYDYAVEQRGWPHHKLLNIAATQENIDVEKLNAMQTLRILIRLCGLMMFIFRNSPDLHHGNKLLCDRPRKWFDHVCSKKTKFKNDIHKVNMPMNEITNWKDYFKLLWDTNPMFLVGTKKHGLFYIPEHPTFWQFLTKDFSGEWDSIDISGQKFKTRACADHINCTDWTYMGLCRPRWYFNDFDISELIAAFSRDKVDSYFLENVGKIIIENRSNATGFPNHEFSSLAFVLGIMENISEAETFVFDYNYQFWKNVFNHSQYQPLKHATVENISVIDLAKKALQIAKTGLRNRKLGEEIFLEPVDKIIHDQKSRSEIILETTRKGKTKIQKAHLLVEKFRI